MVTNDGQNMLYKNIEGKRFEMIGAPGLTDKEMNSNGVVFFDIENDGDLDLYVANGGNQHNQFFRNRGNDYNWIKLKLQGTVLNRAAIGAKVQITAGGLTQTQEVSSQSGGGCGGQKPFILHFGIGHADKIDKALIIWPNGDQHEVDLKEINTIHQLKKPEFSRAI